MLQQASLQNPSHSDHTFSLGANNSPLVGGLSLCEPSSYNVAVGIEGVARRIVY